MGDYPLKEKNLVIADPDILTFDLNDHKWVLETKYLKLYWKTRSFSRPAFFILASDGLWDTFSNEEAVLFVKKHLHEPDYGAKSLTMQSYHRGSVDNITVLVIVFRNGVYKIGESNMNSSDSIPKQKLTPAPLTPLKKTPSLKKYN